MTPALELQVACRQTFERQPRLPAGLPAEREPAAVQWRQPSTSVLLLVFLGCQPVNDGLDEIPALSCPRLHQTGAEIVRPPIWRLHGARPSLYLSAIASNQSRGVWEELREREGPATGATLGNRTWAIDAAERGRTQRKLRTQAPLKHLRGTSTIPPKASQWNL